MPQDDTPQPDGDGEPGAGFAGLGLGKELLDTLTSLGYEEPTPIQRAAIPHLLDGRDLLGQAATGTGKTAAFALPIIDRIGRVDPGEPLALVVVPTRELAVQVSEAIFAYGRNLGIRVVPVFGGQPVYRQVRSLAGGAHVVVATPGRAVDLIERKVLGLSAVHTVVLDEADEMLDMGFSDDINSILTATPHNRQTVLFSATMPSRIRAIAKAHQRDPVRVEMGRTPTEGGEALVRQTVYFVHRSHKPSALARILDVEGPTAAIVFCRTRTEVDELTVTMNARGYRAEGLHGGMDQSQRDRVMGRLRDGTAELLVATDVAARGLDVDSLTHVINYDVPTTAESYVHRIGRVGRAGREGVAITVAEPRQRRLLGNIERLIGQKIPVERVPSVADLRERQTEVMVGAVVEAMEAEDLETYEAVLEGLAERDLRNVALAALKLLAEERGSLADEVDIPDATTSPAKGAQKKGKTGRDGRSKVDNKGKKGQGGAKQRKGPAGGKGDTGFLFVSVGRSSGVRPGDLVGAIANEGGLSGSDVGPIRISDHYSVVGVPDASIDHVVNAMEKTSVRGKKAKVRRFVE